MPAVTGTPGAALWNPGTPTTAPCCSSPGSNGAWYGRRHDRDRSSEVIAVPVPVVIGGEADPPPDAPQNEQMTEPPPEAPAPPVSVVFPPAAAAPPGNGMPNPPPEHAQPARCVPPPVNEPPHVLIALRNGWVYAAVAYWVEHDTLHYITTDGHHNQASLNLVDRPISARLNQGSMMPLVLP